MSVSDNVRHKAVLISIDTGEFDVFDSLQELRQLCESANCDVVVEMYQRRDHADAAYFVGTGKLSEAKNAMLETDADLVVFDGELSASQLRNCEDFLDCAVLDRTMVILDIFASGARSREGSIQVELAQLKYRLPRLSGIGNTLSRLGGGIGTRGPGETQLETDRRHISRRIQYLRKELENIQRKHSSAMRRREHDRLPTVALTGYTNAGKSTLLNYLTGANVLAQDKLFATLDPTARGFRLENGKTVIFVDTVGFIQRIPHHLIEAFRSTLQHVIFADVILNVLDISAPDYAKHNEVTTTLLSQLGCEDIPIITVLNKCDKLYDMPLSMGRDSVLVSSKNGIGIPQLLDLVSETLGFVTVRAVLHIPYDEAGIVSALHDEFTVHSQAHENDYIVVVLTAESVTLNSYKKYIHRIIN